MLLKMRLHNIYGYEFVTVKKNHFINTQAERKLMTGILVYKHNSHIPTLIYNFLKFFGLLFFENSCPLTLSQKTHPVVLFYSLEQL
jgi:hypothetical protein